MRTVYWPVAISLVIGALISSACGDGRGPGPMDLPVLTGTAPATAVTARFEFSPPEGMIGEVLNVRGTGWLDPEVRIYLIPEDQSAVDVAKMRADGDLFSIAVGEATNGEFEVNVSIPEELRSENGRRTWTVIPGTYQVGVQGRNTLLLSGPFTIKE